MSFTTTLPVPGSGSGSYNNNGAPAPSALFTQFVTPNGSVSGFPGTITIPYPNGTIGELLFLCTVVCDGTPGTYAVGIGYQGTNCRETFLADFTISNGVQGCTDPSATNYNPNATVNDGGCVYPTLPPLPGPGPTPCVS